FNFPDLVEIAAIPLGPNRSTYVFYSQSLYGYSAYGVNLARATHVATTLNDLVSTATKNPGDNK
ncbi:MAG: hypothetical protein POH28_15770, partial [Acidocella sp.]|nr:hypothetical protein [Acidocella sp.]